MVLSCLRVPVSCRARVTVLQIRLLEAPRTSPLLLLECRSESGRRSERANRSGLPSATVYQTTTEADSSIYSLRASRGQSESLEKEGKVSGASRSRSDLTQNAVTKALPLGMRAGRECRREDVRVRVVRRTTPVTRFPERQPRELEVGLSSHGSGSDGVENVGP